MSATYANGNCRFFSFTFE
uniref:Uncharacterized protein n=1 Tax=Anguilla anguilla TaxID=7936 RepID=A0A0E9QZQ2_ANGAN